jgi:Mrp family chromosome partitioning ATPase
MAECANCPAKERCSKESAECMMEQNPDSEIKHVVAVASGKGGVGKSTVAALLAWAFKQKGLQVGLMDADLTGPSIPRLLGVVDEKPIPLGNKLLPVVGPDGLLLMSIQYLLDEETKPVIWRGPLLAGTVKQFWTEVVWGKLDVLVIDLPPGTGDVPLTILQSVPVDGVLMVALAQDMVSMVVQKAVGLVREMGVPLLGVVENMTGLVCPHCGEEVPLFGDEEAEKDFTAAVGAQVLARLPMRPDILGLSRKGFDALTEESRKLIDGMADAVSAELEKLKEEKK